MMITRIQKHNLLLYKNTQIQNSEGDCCLCEHTQPPYKGHFISLNISIAKLNTYKEGSLNLSPTLKENRIVIENP